MCIPITARSPGTAMLFMDWILEPENAAQNVAWNGYPQPCEGGKQEFAKLVKDEPSIDVDLESLAGGGMEYRLDDPEARQLWTSIFTEVKAGLMRARWRSDRRAASGTGSCCPAASGCCCCSRSRCALVLALSFGYVDDLGRAVYCDRARQLLRRVQPDLLRRSCCARSSTRWRRPRSASLIGYPVAYYIARYGGRYRNVLIALLVLPFFVNYLVRTYAWVALLADEGLVNNALIDLGLSNDPIQMINTPWAVIGGLTYGYLIFMILPVYGSLERLDRSVIEAGKDLYGTPLQTFLHVTLPQTKQGILAGAVLVFLPSVGDFVSAQLLGGPDTYMVGNLIQDQFFAANNWPFGAALTVVMMLFLSVWMVAYLRSAARDVTRRGDMRRLAFDKPRFLRVFSVLVYLFLFAPILVVILFSFNSIKSLNVFRRLLAAVVPGVPRRPVPSRVPVRLARDRVR